MNKCIPEDALRAYLDNEMSAADTDTVSGHLASCTACTGKSEILHSEAAMVEALLGSLAPDQGLPAAAPPLLRPIGQPRVTERSGWTAAISLGAVAAVTVFAFGVLTGHPTPQAPAVGKKPPGPTASSTVAVDQPKQGKQLTPSQQENRQQAQQRRPINRPVADRTVALRPNLSPFIPLDNDGPIESGLIYRVKLPGSLLPSLDPAVISSEMAADVIVDGSGRPRAFRFVGF